jgi:hypothetical protein
MKDTMLPAGVIDPQDLKLMTLVDTPEAILEALTGANRSDH